MKEGEVVESDCINDAIANFTDGLNCTEAILKAFNDHYKLGLTKDCLKVATGFGAGIGATKDICGSLTGGVLVLSSVAGRTTAKEPLDTVYAAESALCERFKKAFGSTNCGELTKLTEWGTPNHIEYCIKCGFIFGICAGLMEELSVTM